ncbi:MAG TPA: hypothetical protein VFF40_08330 [Acidimicrobiia bacterium]|nr:hypothetical protein [Acidimicrobiia bacterium]
MYERAAPLRSRSWTSPNGWLSRSSTTTSFEGPRTAHQLAARSTGEPAPTRELHEVAGEIADPGGHRIGLMQQPA